MPISAAPWQIGWAAPVSQGYGMSELSPVSHITPHDGGLASVGTVAPLDSCGWTVPNSASKLVDPDTGPAKSTSQHEGLSETGELWFKGPNVMAGYLGNEAATRETIDADGFLHTGDLAQVDSYGCVYVVDRLEGTHQIQGLPGAAAPNWRPCCWATRASPMPR